MSQYDFGTIDPYVADGVALANMLNSWRDAIHSWHRGAARPSYIVPGMMWVNDSGGPTQWLVQVYMGATVGDIVLFVYDTTTGGVQIGATQMTVALLLAQANASPSMRWNATGNAANVKAWRATVPVAGTLRFGAYNDAGVEIGGITFNRDGKLIADLSLATGLPPSGVFIGIAPPPTPAPGQQWWKSDDGLMYVYYDDGNSQQWVPVAPTAAGSILQRKVFQTGAMTGPVGALIPNDNTIPQITEGQEFMTVAITPLRAASFLDVTAVVNCSRSVPGGNVLGALFRDATPDAFATASVMGIQAGSTGGGTTQLIVKGRVAAGSTAATTVRFRAGGDTASGGTMSFNGQIINALGALFNGTWLSSLTVEEVI